MVSGTWSPEIWSCLSVFPSQKQAKAIILSVTSWHCLAVTGFMGHFCVPYCGTWITEVDCMNTSEMVFCHWGGFWPFPCSRGHGTPKIWYKDPHLTPCPMEKWNLVRFYRFSLHWQEWDLSLMDRVSWCKSCITWSEKLLTQGMTECFIFSSAAGIRSFCSCSSPPFYFF